MPRYNGFVGESYVGRSRIAAADELVNLYVEKNSPTGKAPYVLYSAPGFDSTPWVSLSGSSVRGLANINGVVYAVTGSELSYVTDRNSSGGLGSITGGSGANRVSIAGSTYTGGDIDILVAAGGTLNHVTVLSGGGHIGPSVVPDITADDVIYLDGTFYALDTTTSSLYASAPGDGSTWDPSDVVQRSDSADNWSSMLVHRGELYLIGSRTGSVYYDSGAEVFPLSPHPSGKLAFGAVSGRTAAIVNGSPAWLAQDNTGTRFAVKVEGGYNPKRISTHAVEAAWAAYDVVDDADAFAFQEQGHWFYVLSFPSEGESWCYDDATGMWCRLSPGRSNDLSDLDVFPAWTYTYDYEHAVHLVGSRSDGKIWDIGSRFYTNPDGSGMLRLRRAPHLANENRVLRYAKLTIDCEVGVGNDDEPDPQITMRFSDNGGQTFGADHDAPLGAEDAFDTPLPTWTQLGASRDRVFEVSCNDPVSLTLIDAYLETR